MKLVKIGKRCSALQGAGDDVIHSYGSNQGIVNGRDSQLIVDSGFHYATARRILSLKGRHGTNKQFIVNTHYHSDHVFGNGVLADQHSVIISHRDTRGVMERKSRTLLEHYRARDPRLSALLRGVEICPPTLTFHDRIFVFLDGKLEVDLMHPGFRAHTEGDCLVFVPEDRVLFAGDILWVGYHPNLEDADIQGQISALKMILGLKPRKIVPGHGPVCGPGEVRRFIRYLEEFEENSRKGLKEDLTGDRLVRRVIPPWSWNWKMRWLMESYVKNLPRKNG